MLSWRDNNGNTTEVKMPKLNAADLHYYFPAKFVYQTITKNRPPAIVIIKEVYPRITKGPGA
jgi:hypothetical protein